MALSDMKPYIPRVPWVLLVISHGFDAWMVGTQLEVVRVPQGTCMYIAVSMSEFSFSLEYATTVVECSSHM